MPDIEAGLKLLAEYDIDCVIVGGVAASLHGFSQETSDVDACYARYGENLQRLADALRSVHATLRGAPRELPFILDAETLSRGLNFTFETEVGHLDLLGEVQGIGQYDGCIESSVAVEMFGYRFQILSLEKLIVAKRTAGRTKDLLALPELEAILEYQKTVRRETSEIDGTNSEDDG